MFIVHKNYRLLYNSIPTCVPLQLASLVYQSVENTNPYASNWLERMRKLKRLRSQV